MEPGVSEQGVANQLSEKSSRRSLLAEIASPLKAFEGLEFQFDPQNDPYIPLAQAEKFRPADFSTQSRPGFPLSGHNIFSVAGSKDPEAAKANILQEGLLVPSRHSILGDPLWQLRHRGYTIITATPYIWTQEFRKAPGIVQRYPGNEWRDPLVGLTPNEAKAIAPNGLKYCESFHIPDRQKQIWRYVPVKHIIAVIDRSRENFAQLADAYQGILNTYKNGESSEARAVEGLSELVRQMLIEQTDLSIPLEELTFRIAAASTEALLHKLVYTLACPKQFDTSRKDAKDQLNRVTPSFGYTIQLRNSVLTKR